MDAKSRVCETFFNRFANLHDQSGWSINKLADISGLDRSTIINYRQRKHTPNAVSVAVIAEAFGVSTDWLLGVGEWR